jgi:hypothetical protein
VDIGVLEKDYFSGWPSICSTFAVPKKNGTRRVRLVTDFRKLNLHPFSIP